MNVKPIFMILFLFTSVFVSGCANNQVDGNDPEKVRNAVIAYLEEEDRSAGFYTVKKWENASVRKTIADESYKNLDHLYMGKEIFIVTIADSLAAPLIFVDPETLEVIGIMPGE